jgi:hypothetical protein
MLRKVYCNFFRGDRRQINTKPSLDKCLLQDIEVIISSSESKVTMLVESTHQISHISRVLVGRLADCNFDAILVFILFLNLHSLV